MSDNKKMHIVIIVDIPYVNTFQTIVYEAQKRDDVEVTCVIAPLGMANYDNITYQSIREMMTKAGIPFVEGYDETTKKCLDVKTLNPDIVMLQTPYNRFHCREYRSDYLGKFAHLIMISYGSNIVDDHFPPHAGNTALNPFWKDCDVLLVENTMLEKFVNDDLPDQAKALGYIKIDRYLNYKDNKDFPRPKRPEGYEHIIAWKPRWVGTIGYSNFITYINWFLETAAAHPKDLFLFVPHLHLHDSLIEKKIYTKKSADDIFERLRSTPNIKMTEGENFLDDLCTCDVFIGDYSSTLSEMLLMDIPVIYTPTEVVLNDYGKKFCEAAYVAENIKEIEKVLTDLFNGIDPKKEARKAFYPIGTVLPKNKTFARDFLDYVVSEPRYREKRVPPPPPPPRPRLTLKYKVYYKVWKHLNKRLKKKKII